MHKRHPVPVVTRARILGVAAAARVRRVSPMGRQCAVLILSLAGVIAGAALISLHAVGFAVIADSVFGVVFALVRDVPASPQPGVPSHEDILERFRSAP